MVCDVRCLCTVECKLYVQMCSWLLKQSWALYKHCNKAWICNFELKFAARPVFVSLSFSNPRIVTIANVNGMFISQA
ncbi:hypothetical protein L6452_04400 [Arctium lappa]|uniref:Uncharacterized protein n=1 Tax=Arctium lappa TaxID=4217 RepID=A0ACB9FQF9_ARCLA|nr:hypothetical protein L6452_04400 [Arctium lappa]